MERPVHKEEIFSQTDLELAGQMAITLFQAYNKDPLELWGQLSSLKRFAANFLPGKLPLDSALYEATEFLRKKQGIPDIYLAKVAAEIVAWGISKPRTND